MSGQEGRGSARRRVAAERWAIAYLNSGKVTSCKEMTFGQYAKGWFEWETCAFVKKRANLGRPLTRSYVDRCRGNLKKHILPFLAGRPLHEIDTKLVDAFALHLVSGQGNKTTKLCPQSVINVFNTLRLMIREAIAQNLMDSNPVDTATLPTIRNGQHSIIESHEMARLFNPESLQHVWGGSLVHFAVNLLAASTGMRQREVLTLPRFSRHAFLHQWSVRVSSVCRGDGRKCAEQIPNLFAASESLFASARHLVTDGFGRCSFATEQGSTGKQFAGS